MEPFNDQPCVFFKEIEAQLRKRVTGSGQKSNFEEIVPIHGISKHAAATHRKNTLSKSNCSGTEQLKMLCKKTGVFQGSNTNF